MGQATSPRAPRPRVVSSAECEHVEVQRAECMIGIRRSHRLLHLLTSFLTWVRSPRQIILLQRRLAKNDGRDDSQNLKCERVYVVRPALKPSYLTASLVEADLRCSIRIPDRARPGHFSSLGRVTSRCVESESTESAESRVEQGSRLSGSPVICIGATGHMIFHFNFLNRKNRDHLQFSVCVRSFSLIVLYPTNSPELLFVCNLLIYQ